MIRALALLSLFVATACGPQFHPAPTEALSAPSGSKYFSAPWPDDHRLVDGALQTSDFPFPNSSDLVRSSLGGLGNKLVRGWGTQSPVYLPFTGALALDSLPQTPEESVAANASVSVIDIDDASPDNGQRTMVELKFFDAPTTYLPANVLAVRPVTGFPLRQATRYAAIVTTAVRDASGKAVGPDQAMFDVLFGSGNDGKTIRSALSHLGIDPHTVALAVVFTTQSVYDELLPLRDWALAQPASQAQITFKQDGTTYKRYEGSYDAPYLLHGTPPYLTDGGDLQYDASGAPIVALTESMRLCVCVPHTAPPAAGYPVVMYSHGTGGNFRSVVGDLCEELGALGIVSVGIDQVLHGPRAHGAGPTSCLSMGPEVCFFNPLNPVAARNLPRQSAIDHFFLKKALGTLGSTVPLDLRQLSFFGHSQGGLTGSLYAAIDSGEAPYGTVLSGTGGHLTTTILVRKDPLDFKTLAEGPLLLNLPEGEHLDVFHPALALVQTLAEAADPMNYAREWLTRPDAPKDMYMTSGLMDPFAPPIGSDALAALAGIPALVPSATPTQPFLLRGLQPAMPPVSSNVSAGSRMTTAGFQQFPNDGHYAVFTAPAHAQWRKFFSTLFSSGTATIPPLQ